MTNPMLAQFIPEARDLLAAANEALLSLERTPGDPDLVNTVFRSLHTLKGSSGIFDVAPLTQTVHACEDLLGQVRAGETGFESAMADGVFACLDAASRWLDHLEAEEALPPEAAAEAAALVEDLRGWLGTAAPDEAGGAAEVPALDDFSWLARLPEAERIEAVRAALQDGAPLTALVYDPAPDCFFNGDDPVQNLRQLPGLCCLAFEPRADWPGLDEFDPFTCNLRFFVLCAAPVATVGERMGYVADQCRAGLVGAADLICPAGEREGGEVFGDFSRRAEAMLAAGDWEALADAARGLEDLGAPDLYETSVLRWIALLAELRAEGVAVPDRWLSQLAAGVATGEVPVLADARPGPRPVARPAAPAPLPAAAAGVLAAQRELLSASRQQGEGSGCAARAALRVTRNALRACGRDDLLARLEEAVAGDDGGLGDRLDRWLETLLADVDPQQAAQPSAGPRTGRAATSAGDSGGGRRQGTVRVDQARLDSLMNLVAELVVAKNALPYLARRAQDTFGSRELAREIKDHHALVHRIVQDLQGMVMSVRMLPMGNVFQRFPRIVRDLSRKLGKQVELVMDGEETEADKNVVENLADPLVHLIRNSIDHGLEAPEERVAAGKPETGTIRLAARHENDSVVIEVSDDGRGIDPETVKAKAVEKGLIDSARAGTMSDDEARALIFAAGFSTVSDVSEVSGRGVGMDVVRDTVDSAGGRIDILSRKGEGTLLRLSLPLNLAVTRVMTVECGGGLYGIPMGLVVETVKVPRDRVHTVAGREAVVLRDNIVPLVRLARVLDRGGGDEPEEVAILVTRVRGALTGLVVDEFRGGMELIAKPMDGILGGVRGFSSVATLGDGRVLLILQVEELV